jgi:uncharacterized RDD family membrane protein YckC
VDPEDRMSIATPEGLELDLVLAGAGSRLIAALLDLLLKVALLVAVGVVTVWTSPGSGLLVAAWSITFFLVWFGYDVLFELTSGGRTPGKRWTGLRVLATDGSSVGAGASVVRNLLRLVDAIPGAYLVGIVLVALTKHHQRVGDLVAGTLVVRERRDLGRSPRAGASAGGQPLGRTPADDELATWDVSAVTAEEAATVARFLDRRHGLDPAARRRIAEQLASRLLPKVVGPAEAPVAERFLEDLVSAKSHRG